jgi:anti-sigma factor RsiW
MVCREAVEVASDYLEGALRRRARRRYEAHLANCPHCTEYLAQVRAVIDAAGRVEPDDLSPAAQDGLLEVYRAWRAIDNGGGQSRPTA